MDIFIHLLYFCPPQPRLGAIVCWNAGKVYGTTQVAVAVNCDGLHIQCVLKSANLCLQMSGWCFSLEKMKQIWAEFIWAH